MKLSHYIESTESNWCINIQYENTQRNMLTEVTKANTYRAILNKNTPKVSLHMNARTATLEYLYVAWDLWVLSCI